MSLEEYPERDDDQFEEERLAVIQAKRELMLMELEQMTNFNA